LILIPVGSRLPFALRAESRKHQTASTSTEHRAQKHKQASTFLIKTRKTKGERGRQCAFPAATKRTTNC